jgi:hypothetical protein
MPTNKSSRLVSFEQTTNVQGIDKSKTFYKLLGGIHSIEQIHQVGYVSNHIYITNNEEIKKGNWVYSIWDKEIKRASKDIKDALFLKKVILTTDKELDGVQAIPNDFLEWFVAKANDSGKPIDVVEVESWSDDLDGVWLKKYKIIILKEEQCICKIGEPYNNLCCNIHGIIPKKEMLEQIENQVKLTESRGERIAKYLDIFKGKTIYNDIALAIEFGYQLRLEEEKDE